MWTKDLNYKLNYVNARKEVGELLCNVEGEKNLINYDLESRSNRKKKDCEFNYPKQSKDFLKDENSISKSKKQITDREK